MKFFDALTTPLAEARTITAEYAALNAQLHVSSPQYGSTGKQWAEVVADLAQRFRTRSVLDYGCGKQTLAQALPDLLVAGYDPAMPGLDALPACADIVICTDVLEHVEPEYILDVLDDIARLAIKAAFVTVATRPGGKILDDGRNAHLTVRPLSWWKKNIEERFVLEEVRKIDRQEFAIWLLPLGRI